MKKTVWRESYMRATFVLLALLLAGCGETISPTAASLEVPSNTPVPTSTTVPTETPRPTETTEPSPEPTSTPEPSPTIAADSDATSACPVSDDESYGYTKENAIRVGGDAFGGPAREREYLDTLRGPDGQVISYEREGSLPFEDTILDAYIVTYAGLDEPARLYLDEYSFEDLFAPVGFTCDSAFPFSTP